MRINMNVFSASEKPPLSLIQLWCHMLASEYLVEPKMAARWVHNTDSRSFVVEFLQSKGWKVHAYTTPALEQNSQPPSHGYVIADDCDQLVHWKLTA
jgi:hypothetical protein